MKTYTMVTVGLLLVSFTSMGQDLKRNEKPDAPSYGAVYSFEPSYLRQAAQNYAVALHSDCDGVVESAITHSTLLRIVAPHLDLDQIQSKLADLAGNGRTSEIRYRAYLAAAVFDNPAKFENTLEVRYTDGDAFFRVVASQVHRTLLGHNIQ